MFKNGLRALQSPRGHMLNITRSGGSSYRFISNFRVDCSQTYLLGRQVNIARRNTNRRFFGTSIRRMDSEKVEKSADQNKSESIKGSESKTSKSKEKSSGAGLVDGEQIEPVDLKVVPPEVPKAGNPSAEISNEESDEYLTTIFEKMEPYIDTYDVYRQLIIAGFSPKQSDEVINYLISQINSKVSKLSTKYSQMYELENERYLFESAQQELRVDITRSREQHINESINLINILERDFNIISDELNNEFLQMKNDAQVTVNDQKSENTLHSKKVYLRIQETNHKITTELNSAMRSEIESLRWHISRWGIMAILVSVFAGCALYYVYKIKTQRRLNERNDFVPLVIYEPSEFDEDDYHTDLDKNSIN
ncbi:hypothetical protein CLIB1423_04S00298 [[Candida] railenensis]|uniref:Uncharacterized protein n=1 Tax=[Candida] railenensis TaxID=45579 RepID=A0A9P0QNB5_9ASCO|nr:hypothetical protein CLIB1423_04S00298 [[Candida] railenensis]